MKKFFAKLGSYSWGILLFAILFIVSGICLISFSEEALPKIIIAISVFTIVFSIVYAVLTLADKKRDVKFFFRLLGAICALFCGIFLLVKRNDGAIELLTTFVGLMVIIDGSFKLHTTILSKRYKMATWWIMLVLSISCIGGGLFLIKWPPIDKVKVCSVIMGLIMIVDGIQNLTSTFFNPEVDKRMRNEIIAKEQAGEPAEKGNETQEEFSKQEEETKVEKKSKKKPKRLKNRIKDKETAITIEENEDKIPEESNATETAEQNADGSGGEPY